MKKLAVRKRLRIFFNAHIGGIAPILMYHRVQKTDFDPWALSVTPENFEEHVAYLRRKATIVPVAEIVRRLERGRSIRRLAAITFDDGYLDNYTTAWPILRKYQAPATFYITTATLDDPQPFWWDILPEIFLRSPRLPRKFAMQIGREQVTYDLEIEELTSEMRAQLDGWNSTMEFPNHRARCLWHVRAHMYPLPAEVQSEVLARVCEWAGFDRSTVGSSRYIDADQLREIHRDGLVEIGAHTARHCALPSQTTEVQRREIRESKQRLERELGSPVRGFAYPFGDANRASAELVADEGFDYAVTTVRSPVLRGSRRFELPRCLVTDWSPRTFARRIDTWFAGVDY